MHPEASYRSPVHAHNELILGGQRSGKSRRAEQLAAQWLQADSAHAAVLLATGQAWDAEMQARIARHQADRVDRIPSMRTVEVPHDLAAALQQHAQAGTLVVVDCLTLWLTNLMMPAMASDVPPRAVEAAIGDLLAALVTARGPVVLVGNEIGLGVIPLGAQVRDFVDTLGRLNQALARDCSRVTLMVAGLPMVLKDTPWGFP